MDITEDPVVPEDIMEDPAVPEDIMEALAAPEAPTVGREGRALDGDIAARRWVAAGHLPRATAGAALAASSP